MHIHVSVNDADGNNIFASEDPEGTPMRCVTPLVG